MKAIDPDLRIKDIEPEELINENICSMVRILLDDYNQSMTQELFEHAYNRLTFFIKRRFKLLTWAEVEFIFNAMSSGTYTLKKVSVTNILEKFSEYVKAKIERNRIELEKREQKIVTEWADLNKTPYGQAILFRIEMKEKGNHEWDKVPLKDIVEKIANGQLKYKYKPIERKQRFIDSDTIMEVINGYKKY